jgi:hypothetical protein
MSKFKLLSSYVSMAAILAFAGWLAVASFPLIGRPQIQEEAAESQTDNPPAPIAIQPREAAKAAPEATVKPTSAPVKRTAEEPVLMAFQAPPQRIANRVDAAAASLPTAPVPADSHELVTGPVQAASTPAERSAALALLRRAADNGVSHQPKMNPFSFKVTFTASGNLTYTGAGELTEIWMSGQTWRVTESIGNYSLVRIGYSGQRADQQPVSLIPMRSHMLRNEFLWVTEINDAGEGQIRTSAAQWNGKPVTCILLSNVTGPAAQTQSRLWEENEYCVANDSGLLQTHSDAPGAYAVFGYTKNLQFHGKSMPDRITMYVAGAQAVDGDFSITDPSAGDQSLLTPTPQMTLTARPVIPLSKAMKIPLNVPGSTSGDTVQPVMIHAQLDGQGNVVEAELSAAANPSLTQSALDLVKKMHFGGGSHIYVNVRFVPASQ